MADTTLTKAQPAAYTPRTNLDAAIASQPDEAWVAAAGPREHGFLIKIDDEYEFVSHHGDQFARPWQVERGALGSTPAAHAADATVSVEPSIGGGGSLSGTDGDVTVDPMTSIRVSGLTEDNPGEGTIIALPPGVTYDADNGILQLDGTETGTIEWENTEVPGDYHLRLTQIGVEIKSNSGRLSVATDEGAVDTFKADSASGTTVWVGTSAGSKHFRVESDTGDPDYFHIDQTGRVFFSGLPTADPLLAGQLYTDGVPSAGVPKALMISGGPA